MFGKIGERVGTALERFWPKKKEVVKKPEQVAVPVESAPPKVEAKSAKEEKKPTVAQSIFEVSDADKRGADGAGKLIGSTFRFLRGVLIAATAGVMAGTLAVFLSPMLFALLPAAPQFGVFTVALAAAAISAALALAIHLSFRN